MNKVTSLLIALSLCGCATKSAKVSRGEVFAIVSDRSDVLVPQTTHNDNFCVEPLEFSALIARNPISIGGRGMGDAEALVSKVALNSHEKWLNKMRAHAAEIEGHINGRVKPGSFDIMSLPIGFSYKMELDKPRKKAKKGKGR